MTAGIATLPLEHFSKSTRRRSTVSVPSELREFLIGPENELVQYGIGLTRNDASTPPRLEIRDGPLLVWAPSGFGKSQLLNGIAATWAHHRPNDQIILATASELIHLFVHALKIDDVPQFQQRFRRADIVLIDDLDAMSDREPSQEQLASIIEHRQRFGRPTVLTAHHPLSALNLNAQLRSRLSAGLVVPLQLPSRDTRAEILDRICEHRHINLTDDAKACLVEQGRMSVREFASVIKQLSILDSKVDASHVRAVLDSATSIRVDPKAIIRSTARHYGLKVANLTGSSRRKMDVLARGVAMHLIRELTDLSFQQIGQLFEGRDHSTVMHACKKIKRMSQNDASCRCAIRDLRQTHAPRSQMNIDAQ